jgi:hypothetical protein
MPASRFLPRGAAVMFALALLGSIGVGTASADPNNANSRYILAADCDGRTVDLVTIGGAAGHDLASHDVFVVFGATVDGVWTLPLIPGQAAKDLSTCSYSNFGPDIVIYGQWRSDK